MAVRAVSNRGGNVIGWFPSIKMKRLIAFESLIERDLLLLLDYEADVMCIEEQPLRIHYQDEGSLRRYTPDFHVARARRHRAWQSQARQPQQHQLVECKAERHLHSAVNQHKFAAAQAWCAEHGWAFVVVTDRQLRAGYYLRNVKTLTQFARHDVDTALCNDILAVVSEASAGHSCATLIDVLHTVGSAHSAYSPQVFPCLMHMAFHHRLALPLHSELISHHMPIVTPTPIAMP